jgi:hypothetical protein
MDIVEIKELAGQPRRDVGEEDASLESIEALEEVYASIRNAADEASREREAGRREGYSAGEDPAGEKIYLGGRNNFLTSLAGSMRRRGMGEESIFAALMEENEAKCEPPLSEEDVLRIARSIQRYAPADPFHDVSVTPRFPLEAFTPRLKRLIEEAAASKGVRPSLSACRCCRH